MSASLAPSVRRLRSTARAMLAFPEPESWLDVGTGDARFPEAAKQLFPYTAFDGLDPTPRVERARWAERVEEAYLGDLTDSQITARLHARYDVVSLLHHLPHTPDPGAELHAALALLRPGGHLVLELPDPRCAFARILGKRWHAHPPPGNPPLTPLDDLLEVLESQGCTIITTDRRAAHLPHDLSYTLALALPKSLPTWLTTSLLAAAKAADHTLAPLLRHTRFANTYRVIARKGRVSPAAPAPGPPPPAAPARTRPRTPR
ncbi:class I SAM-dependent methyltransferase [Streptomyces sp. NPDC006602]|uniref:class I SAM-dependent methyltransferase n=1 Tax=Streptomyces sp. NPDC006602 TaxID=3364751 RepID=UPI0036B7438A